METSGRENEWFRQVGINQWNTVPRNWPGGLEGMWVGGVTGRGTGDGARTVNE